MYRKCDKRLKVTQRWICKNPECSRRIAKSDEELLGEITELLNSVISNPEMIPTLPVCEVEPSDKVRNLENEIGRMLESPNADREALRKIMLHRVSVSADNAEQFDEQKAAKLMEEKETLHNQFVQIVATKQAREIRQSRLVEIYEILDSFQEHPLAFDDCLLRQILKCVIVESKEKIRVVFKGGLEVEQELD